MKTNMFLNYASITDSSIAGSIPVDNIDNLQAAAVTVIKAFHNDARENLYTAETWQNICRISRDQSPFSVIRKRRIDETDGQWKFRAQNIANKHEGAEIHPGQVIQLVTPFEVLSTMPEFEKEIMVTWAAAENNDFPFA